MVRAVIYTDFDGVLNAFPDDKVLRRGGVGHTQWLKEGDPRTVRFRACVSPDGQRAGAYGAWALPCALVARACRHDA